MPRPKPGEMAPSVQRIKASKEESARRRFAILHSALKDMAKVDSSTLRQAFASQRHLAKWDDATLGVRPMALNTLRRYVNELYPGAVAAFEADRLTLLRRLDTKPAREGSKAALQQSNLDLRGDYQVLVNHVLEFSAQYLDLLQRAADLASSHAFLTDEIKNHLRSYPSAYKGFRVITGGRRD